MFQSHLLERATCTSVVARDAPVTSIHLIWRDETGDVEETEEILVTTDRFATTLTLQVDRNVCVLLSFAWAGALTPSAAIASTPVSIAPEVVILPDAQQVELSAPVDPSHHSFVVEAGALEVVPDAHRSIARWSVPADIPPRRLAAALIDHVTGTAQFVTVAVHRYARVVVKATPEAEVRLYLDDELASADSANGRGVVTLRVLVPPGVHAARVEQTTSRQHPAAPRYDKVPVHDALHVFAVTTRVSEASGDGQDVELAVYAYGDGRAPFDAHLVTRGAPTDSYALDDGRFTVIAHTRRDEPNGPLEIVVTDGQRSASTIVQLPEHRAAKTPTVKTNVASNPMAPPEVSTRPPRSAWELGAYGGAMLGRGGYHALGGSLLARTRWSVLPTMMSLDAGASVWFASRDQTAAGGFEAERHLTLASLGLGSSVELAVSENWRFAVGALFGGLASRSTVRVRQSDTVTVPDTARTGAGLQAMGWLRADRRLGPGAVGLIAQGLIGLTAPDGFQHQPLGIALLAGYAWEP